jgi:hypothetical protein
MRYEEKEHISNITDKEKVMFLSSGKHTVLGKRGSWCLKSHNE